MKHKERLDVLLVARGRGLHAGLLRHDRGGCAGSCGPVCREGRFCGDYEAGDGGTAGL